MLPTTRHKHKVILTFYRKIIPDYFIGEERRANIHLAHKTNTSNSLTVVNSKLTATGQNTH